MASQLVTFQLTNWQTDGRVRSVLTDNYVKPSLPSFVNQTRERDLCAIALNVVWSVHVNKTVFLDDHPHS